MTDVREATHVTTKDGIRHKIKSKWGIAPDGRLAKPSEGGFGCVCEDGVIVDMWQAWKYDVELEPEVKDDKIEQLRTGSFLLGIKYTLMWLVAQTGQTGVLDIQDKIMRDGLAYLADPNVDSQMVGRTGGEA